MLKSFHYRLYPSTPQARMLDCTLETCRRFYNHLLAERRDAYQQHRESIGKFQQLAKVKEHKTFNPFAKEIHSHVLQIVVTDLDTAFQAFFRRLKAGEKPGFPRFTAHALHDVNERTLALGLQPSPSALNFATYRALAAHDPNVALAGLRIELEILLSNMARRFTPEVPAAAPAAHVLQDLRDSGVLSADQARLIQHIMRLCTAAIHGAVVIREQAETILDAATVIRDAYLRWLVWEADAERYPV
jgi:hypothetical protein